MSDLVFPQQMLMALHADGPEPSLGTELSLFGQFVGAWDLEIDFRPRDAPGWRTDGIWLFDWILDGRGIQDVLIHRTSARQITRGTTIRIYDAVEGVWQVAWFGPISRNYVMLTGRADGESISVEGPDGADLLRWSFHEVTPRSFLWHGHVSADGGATWHREQEMRARRRNA